MLVSWSGLGMLSVFVLVAGMAGATFGLRPTLAEMMPFQAAVYIANGIGLLVGAVVNFLFARWLAGRTSTEHSFLGISMVWWSVLATLGGAGFVLYGLMQAG